MQQTTRFPNSFIGGFVKYNIAKYIKSRQPLPPAFFDLGDGGHKREIDGDAAALTFANATTTKIPRINRGPGHAAQDHAVRFRAHVHRDDCWCS